MKWLSAGLTFVNFSTLCGLLLGMAAGGLGRGSALASLLLGTAAAVTAYCTTADRKTSQKIATSGEATGRLSKRAQRRLQKIAPLSVESVPLRSAAYRSFWFWFLVSCFALFALRSFCWLLFRDGEQLKIQSPNNLGDLALHITYIQNFANGVSIWPDNPIYVFSKLRYPAGIDLFNALLSCLNIDLTRGLIWVGLVASLATFYAFYRWGGKFAVAGFLFNGGVAGFQFLKTLKFLDYQGDKTIAWKSIPLAMFVTQRGLLYAIPAGLLLLWHWREKFFRSSAQDRHRGSLPFWLELSLYASMPLFHVHTFMALSIVLLFFFVFGDAPMRKHTAKLVACAFLPATFFVWLITDHFHAGSVLAWEPGLLRKDELYAPFLKFWISNFGVLIPLVMVLIGLCAWQAWKAGVRWGQKLPENLSFLLPAATIFIGATFVKLAPWEWDNLKIMIWAYFLVLPFLWKDLLANQPLAVRVGACVALFGSGFISLFGGLGAGREGYTLANQGELYAVGAGLRKLPVEARFASYPIFNHPLLLQGRKVVMGYPGHLWTQGFDYAQTNAKLTNLMEGEGDWETTARELGVRYIFWGQEEKINYPTSKKPWERTLKPVRFGNWGAIYDLGSSEQTNATHINH